MSNPVKCGLAGALLASFFACGASAMTVGLAANETGYVDGRHVYIDPLTLNGVPWFCISPDLDIQLGPQGYVYTPGVLTAANSVALTGYALTVTQIGEIGALVVKGESDIAHAASTFEIAADASAIWGVEGAHLTADNAVTGQLITADESWAAGRSADFHIMTDTSGVQNLAAAPEPANWALMILGFGVVGALARRRAASAPSIR